ncbi:hypothetical protein COV61_03510 [Candidatus Micrarchaeota archaeon CG11_big_fil_rev_8_21_14_0_20_47_5]|nr:MAG: hypothetical protein COV61_03510 [Candidatus Micrarchaeota archaeon CG11_big_fil_rev_8_21_14_0_20_47_5]
MLKVMEKEAFLFFYAKRPEKQRDLELGEIYRLIDEFDLAERIYFNQAEDRSENREENTKRMYDMSVPEKPRACPKRINYSFASSLAQVYNIDECMKRLKELGHVSESPLDEKLARERLELASFWAENYAPPEMRVKVNAKEEAQKIREGMDAGVKEVLIEFALLLDEEEKELYEKMKGECKEKGVEMAKFFESAYTALLSKNKGPRLIPFAKALGKERVMELMGA